MNHYCVNTESDHEVHKMSCSYLPEASIRKEFEAPTDFAAMAEAILMYSDADGCAHCMSAYNVR